MQPFNRFFNRFLSRWPKPHSSYLAQRSSVLSLSGSFCRFQAHVDPAKVRSFTTWLSPHIQETLSMSGFFDVECSTQKFTTWLSPHMKENLSMSGFFDVESLTKTESLHPIKSVVFILGGPGSGKGTQSKLIEKKYSKFTHISAGDCLREEQCNPKSQDGILISKCIKDGSIVPAELTVRLIQRKIAQSDKQNFLVDGFPRNLDNFLLRNENFINSILERRLLERGKVSGREDDNILSIRKRFNTFYKETFPIVELFREIDDSKVYPIDASLSQEEVYNATEIAMNKIEKNIYKIHEKIKL
eukprot:GSMAST32.ASY1.ANO1.2292.1 assembled CDS